MYRKIILLFGLLLLLAACSEKPQPETTFKSYMKAWEQQDFEKMYNHLSEKSKATISKEEFVTRYTDIYEDIQVKDFDFTYKLPEEETDYKEEDTPQFDFNAKMETIAGPLEINHQAALVYEKGEETDKWAVKWNPSMIFPGMKGDDKIQLTILKPKRGEIFDVNGEPLAANGYVQEVGLVPAWMKEDKEEVKETLAELLNISIESIDKALSQSWVKDDSYVPLVTISASDQEKIDAIRPLNGTKFVKKKARVYPYKEAAAHLTGYTGPITTEQLEERKDKGYTASDIIGKKGLELVLEEELRGEIGAEIFIVDKDKQRQDLLAKKEPVDGKDINLTIDISVQALLYNQMLKEAGTATAINPTTGEVRALVSTPAFDPNQFVLGISLSAYTALQEDPLMPLTNRFTRTYAPGSTFKPITASIGLKTGAIDPAEEKAIPANNQWKKDSWGNYYVTRVKSSDTKVNLKEALVRSDNIYFAMSILDIGEDPFLQEAEQFGFGEKIPFAYPIQASQIANEGDIASEVQLADTAYGQGQVEMSALHLAMSYTPFATKGTLLKPVLLKEDEKAQAWKQDVISAETAELITKDLIQVIESPQGTAKEAKIKDLQLAGKTGTAELKKSKDEKGTENGWFVAWNTEDPSLLVSMMIEDVPIEEGSHYVVPKVKSVFENVFASQ
ncbi:penicillin-binding transpeptidase domain-containing protein [Pseudalkalibacillus sp. SCS-8]|uniref:penicillin-binding transpeptidase domain-containing protein n=1 Tax=Pseudalkalibacillus nanhaiensis TaxID=3115291 RepID=UPI0032DAC423